MRWILILLGFVYPALCTSAQAYKGTCYVAVNGSDHNSGTYSRPFATLTKAQQFLKNKLHSKSGSYVAILRGGTYVLTHPLRFDSDYNPDSMSSITFKAYSNESVTISGGQILKGFWFKTGKANIWKLHLNHLPGNILFFQALFKNNIRLKRAASDTLYSQGPNPAFAHLFRRIYDFPTKLRLVKDSLNVFSQFQYQGNDLDEFTDFSNAEIIQYNSWEATMHKISRIDKQSKIVYYKNPSSYPVGFFGSKLRYLLVNTKMQLKKPEQWFLDVSNRDLYFFASLGENPNDQTFTVPCLDTLLIAAGSGFNHNYINNIKFEHINFSYSASAWGTSAFSEQDQMHNRKLYPWLDFREGFSGGQCALSCGEALTLRGCRGWTFSHCTFTHLGNYAVGLKQFSTNNTIDQCIISDNGGGGVIVGFNFIGGKRKDWPDNISPSKNVIQGCTIYNCGTVFPASVAIGVMQSNHTLIDHNHIHDMPYTGISIGWTFTNEENYTYYNKISNNYIHDVTKTLADGGGIYTLGRQDGTLFCNNYIFNVHHSKHATGASNNGFFFDESSSGFRVDSNVVFNVTDEVIRFHKTDSSKIMMRSNYFKKTNNHSTFVQKILKETGR